MPRIIPLFALVTALLSGSFVSQNAVAAPAPSRFSSGVSASATKTFRSMGLLRGNASVTRVRAVQPTQAAKRKAKASRSAAAGTDINLDFDGFSAKQEAVLRRAAGRSLILDSVFGEPTLEQQGKTVFVVNGPGAAYQPLLNPDPVDGGTIYYQYTDESDEVNEFNFTRLLLLAYQGPHAFSYDFKKGNYIEAWQNGFADAAALLVMYRAAQNKPAFDPTQYSSYGLPIYDLLNHPELANAYIYSRSRFDMVISDFRALVAQAAWLKVAVENQNFFRLFNEKYYTQYAARAAVTPNQLKQIAASVVPTVEGLGFNDWIRRQYALDTSVTTGQKLYAAVSPFPITASGNKRAGFEAFTQAFTTESDGDEKPSEGYGSISAFDEKSVDITAKSSELLASPLLDFKSDSEDAPGQAYIQAYFTGLGTPDQARITLRMRFQSAETTAVFPYISSPTATKSTYYGVTSYGDSGSLVLTPGTGAAENLTVTRGAWTGAKDYVTGPTIVTSLKLGSRTFKRNTAWFIPGAGARGVAFVLEGGATSGTFTLKAAAGASKIRMISLPLNPTETDEAKILGINSADLDLARYRPNLSPSALKDGVIEFGIGSDRHEIYPNISGNMSPGRGYWLGVDGAFQRSISGIEPPRDRLYDVPVLGGWNQIGVPFTKAISVDKLKVRYGGFAAVSYSKAIANGWVRPGIWRWKPAGGYDRVDGTSSGTLQPFEGYYLYAVPARGVSLVFDPAATTKPTATAAGWTVALSAATVGVRDGANRFGVSTAVAAAKPPAAAKVVTLRFLESGSADSNSSGAGGESGWADSFLSSIDREGIWRFIVEGTAAKERVTLSWGSLSGLPQDLKLTLIDSKPATQLRLTNGGSYKWNSDGTPRSFTLKATRIAQPLISLFATGSNEQRIKVTMNIAAKGRLEIQNGEGDSIAVLKAGTFTAGASTFVWNGNLTNGKRAPIGRYLVVWTPEVKDDKSASRSFNWK